MRAQHMRELVVVSRCLVGPHIAHRCNTGQFSTDARHLLQEGVAVNVIARNALQSSQSILIATEPVVL